MMFNKVKIEQIKIQRVVYFKQKLKQIGWIELTNI